MSKRWILTGNGRGDGSIAVEGLGVGLRAIGIGIDHPARYALAVADSGCYPLPTGDAEPSFSRHACPFCGSELGGYRIESELVEVMP